MLDASKLGPKLYQGSYPREGIRQHGFDVLVLCAEELQLREAEPGLRVIHCPLNDSPYVQFGQREWNRAWRAAEQVTDLLLRGARVLVTCAQGRNRSGLVSALVLYRITAMNGVECVHHIRQLRADALTNHQFVAALRQLPRKTRTEPIHRHRRALHRISSGFEHGD